MAIKAIINNTEKEIEQIKNSNEQDIDYVYSRIGDTEVEGEPPISIKSIGGELANYRIYGNTVDGESVGDLVESGEHAGEYKVPVTVEGKNLLQNNVTSQTINGVRFTLNSDGSVTCNGQASSLSVYKIPIYLYASTLYILNGCPSGGSIESYSADLRYNDVTVSSSDIGNGVNYTCTQTGTYAYGIRIASGYTCDNITFYPMIRKADIEDDTYEPYHPPVTTPIYLPKQIRKVGDEAEYIDYEKQKMHRVRKNLLKNTAKDREIDVTFTVNSDGSVTCNGTASAKVSSDRIPLSLPAGSYYLNGTPSGGSLSTYHMFVWYYNDEFELIWYNDIGDGVSFTIDNSYDVNVGIEIISGYTCNNLTFYPMIRKADIEDDTYESYIENTEVNVTLPALSTIKGTNILSIGTSIQPSNIYIKDNFDYKKVFTATRAIEDELPLNYKNIEDNDSTLSDYRIYGNTVDGESVGDRTGNLFDKTDFIQTNLVARADNLIVPDPYTISTILPCNPNTKYTISKIVTNRFIIWGCTDYPTKDKYCNLSIASDYDSSSLTFTTGNDDNYLLVMLFYQRRPTEPTIEDVKGSLMFNYGEALPYEPYGYKVPVTVSNGTDTLTTPIYLPEPIKMVGDEAEYIDYAEQKQHRVRKNLLKNTATSQTINGVTFTVNSDGSLTCNGTARATGYIKLKDNLTIEAGEYIVTANNTELFNHWYIDVTNLSNELLYRITSDSDAISINSDINVRVWFNIQNGYTCDNLTFYPMIRKADIEDDTYESYIENTDIDVTLPVLPTLTGTNVLSAGTAVQPSEVYIKGKIKEIN